MMVATLFSIGVQLSAPRWVGVARSQSGRQRDQAKLLLAAWAGPSHRTGRRGDAPSWPALMLTYGAYDSHADTRRRSRGTGRSPRPLPLTGRSGPLARAFHNLMQPAAIPTRYSAYGSSLPHDCDPELWTESITSHLPRPPASPQALDPVGAGDGTAGDGPSHRSRCRARPLHTEAPFALRKDDTPDHADAEEK